MSNTTYSSLLVGFPSITAFEKNGLKINFSFDKVAGNPSNVVSIMMTATNSLAFPMTDFVFQAAVPKVGMLSLTSSFEDLLQSQYKLQKVLVLVEK